MVGQVPQVFLQGIRRPLIPPRESFLRCGHRNLVGLCLFSLYPVAVSHKAGDYAVMAVATRGIVVADENETTESCDRSTIATRD